VPDNVLFDDGKGRALRQMLMNRCNLHTILRLPIGLFYAQGVKTNVIFYTRANDEAPPADATKAVWIYDARSNVPTYGKTNPFKSSDLADFIAAFGDDAFGEAPRHDQGEEGRFRCFTRAEIAARNDNLDITWLKDTSGDPEDGLDTPEDIASAIESHLMAALVEVRALVDELGDGVRDADALEVAE
jgi:type I restriction enzyme M protein